MKTNYHTHTLYSDGAVSVEDIVNCAAGNDFDIIGISDHSPVPFDSAWNMKYEKIEQYLKDIENAKNQVADKILVLKGMEIDYFPNLQNIKYFRSFGLDYTIGSMHYLYTFPSGRHFNVDKSAEEFSKGLKEIYNNNFLRLAKDYYHLVNQMVLEDPPDIIAHLTLIEKFKQKLQLEETESEEYKQIVYETLEVISQTDCVLEINARSWYRGLLDEFVPPMWVLKKAKELGIPITISGDVHQPQEFGMYWNDAIQFAKAAGYDSIVIFKEKGNRETIKI